MGSGRMAKLRTTTAERRVEIPKDELWNMSK